MYLCFKFISTCNVPFFHRFCHLSLSSFYFDDIIKLGAFETKFQFLTDILVTFLLSETNCPTRDGGLILAVVQGLCSSLWPGGRAGESLEWLDTQCPQWGTREQMRSRSGLLKLKAYSWWPVSSSNTSWRSDIQVNVPMENSVHPDHSNWIEYVYINVLFLYVIL